MKLAILHDDPRWAQGRHSSGLQKYAPPGIQVERFSLGDFTPGDYDAVYCINLASSHPRLGRKVVSCVASHAWQHKVKKPDDWRTNGVTRNRNALLGIRMVRRVNGVICRNEQLRQWAAKYGKAVRIPAGVDTDIFNPANRTENQRLRVGWCGQINPERDNHFKGYYDVYLPLKERLQHRYEFTHNPNTAKTARGIDEMVEWYQSLDVFLCTASAEGTPNPPMEAAACGCVVLSTDVGQLSDWNTLREHNLLCPDYGNKREAAEVIDELEHRLAQLEDSSIRGGLSEELLDSISREYDYQVLAPKTLEAVCAF